MSVCKLSGWEGGEPGDLRELRANGVTTEKLKTILYLELIREKLPDLRLKDSIFDPTIDLPKGCYGILEYKLTNPCLLELIWSYWHEEGMLVQSMNAISLSVSTEHRLAPPIMTRWRCLRSTRYGPLNNLIWGYIQDEQHRLSLLRRVYEYDHHYGMTLQGKAVPSLCVGGQPLQVPGDVSTTSSIFAPRSTRRTTTPP